MMFSSVCSLCPTHIVLTSLQAFEVRGRLSSDLMHLLNQFELTNLPLHLARTRHELSHWSFVMYSHPALLSADVLLNPLWPEVL